MRGGGVEKLMVPEVTSVHSNRLAGIISNRYQDDPDDPDIVELDDDDDDEEEDILVPTLNSRQPVPDYDIIADDNYSQSYEEDSGEYIEDGYEEQQTKFIPQQEQYQVYDLE